MESYEKIRKMGEISEQLKKHGLAEDSTDALTKAENMIAKEGTEFYVSQEKLKENVEKAEASCNDANKEIKQLTSQFNDKFSSMESQVGMVRDKMNEIIAKLNELESRMNNQPKQEVQATLASSKVEPNPVEAKPPEDNTNKVVPEVKKQYNSNDVSVDKMFYTGKK